jgi:hypothetical protein
MDLSEDENLEDHSRDYKPDKIARQKKVINWSNLVTGRRGR